MVGHTLFKIVGLLPHSPVLWLGCLSMLGIGLPIMTQTSWAAGTAEPKITHSQTPQPAAIKSFALVKIAVSDGAASGSDSSGSVSALSAGGWTDSNCNGCHEIQAAYSHPINIKPSMAVPNQLPLSNGQITCITCHDNSSVATHMQARKTHNPLLRSGITANLCAQCHNPGESSRAAMHGAGIGRAHLRQPESTKRFPTASYGRTRTTSTSDRTTIDAVSQSCLVCHDGSIASDVSTGSSSAIDASLGQLKAHPMGMTYPSGMPIATSSGGQTLFRTRTMLDPRITLTDGKVGCLSCHNPYSTQDHLLVMPNTRSQLCLTCHIDH